MPEHPPGPAQGDTPDAPDEGSGPYESPSDISSDDPVDVEPGALLPASDDTRIKLTPEEEAETCHFLYQMIDSHTDAVQQRRERIAKIKNAYHLMADTDQQGPGPDAENHASTLVRRHVNGVFSRTDSTFSGIEPVMSVDVLAGGYDDEETKERQIVAHDTEVFLEAYSHVMRLPEVRPSTIHAACLEGDAVNYIHWKIEDQIRTWKTADGTIKFDTTETGRVEWMRIQMDNIVMWPLDAQDEQDMLVVGHRVTEPGHIFAEMMKEIGGVDQDLIDRIAREPGDGTDDEKEQRLLREGIRTPSTNPFKGEVSWYEFWCHRPLLEGKTPQKYQIFYSYDENCILGDAFHNANPGRYHPYWGLHFWREDGEGSSWLGTGVGHEVYANHVLDAALVNMELDNARIIGHNSFVRPEVDEHIANVDVVMPGRVYTSEKPNEWQTLQLGQPIPWLQSRRSQNEAEAGLNSGLTFILQGMGDPVMKSGTTSEAVRTLQQEAQQKFKKVDTNFRLGFSRMYMYSLMLVQQYAPEAILYSILPEDPAGRVWRNMKYKVPRGDLQSMFRLSVKAPSAADNVEVRKQNALLVYNFASQFFTLAMQAAPQAVASNPAGAARYVEDAFRHVGEVYNWLLDVHEVEGVTRPKLSEGTPLEEQLNEANQMLEQMQQQLQGLQQQQQQAQQGQQMQGLPPQGQMPPQQQGFPQGVPG